MGVGAFVIGLSQISSFFSYINDPYLSITLEDMSIFKVTIF